MESNIIQSEKMNDEDSLISTSTSVSNTESIMQDISKNKNIFLITKNIEQRIVEILSYLQSDSNLATNKMIILKYLQSLFISVEFNSEIFSRKFIKEKEKLNLYKIIINQYIFYTNPLNSKADEENYRSDLQTLFILLLSQITLEKDTYHYILSSLINYMNEKNIADAKKKYCKNLIENESTVNLKEENILRILVLLKYFYGYYKRTSDGILNYFFFSGDSESSITIQNKDIDNNKKLLNLDETLCIMLFIKVLPSEFIKAVYPKINFKLFELKFNDKKNSICININIDNYLTTSSNNILYKLSENETNCLIFKFNKKKSIINGEIYIGFNKVELPPLHLDLGKDKNSKIMEEIKEITLFKNFIGTCSNIIIYKEKKNEGVPKFLLNTINNKTKSSSNNESRNSIRKTNQSFNPIFTNGIYNEELYSFFVYAELNDQIDISRLKTRKHQNINYNIFKEFLNNNMIAIYIPNRYIIPNQSDDKNITNATNIILIDSINGLNAEFKTRTPSLNGIHIFQNLYEDNLDTLGGINNLMPILEFMLNNEEFLTLEIFSSYFNLLSVYVLSPKHKYSLIQEYEFNFFKNLSYFLEQMPYKFFNDELAENFKAILGFFNGDNNLEKFNNQFHDYILLNEKIFLKFNENNQQNILNQIYTNATRKNVKIDIIKIIKIMLNYDKDRMYKFCCKEHSNYFNENYVIMNPELSTRLKPIMKLLEIMFEKIFKYNIDIYKENITSNINSANMTKKKMSTTNILKFEDYDTYNDNNFHLLFYLLTFDISPCLQKSIICLLSDIIKQITYEKFSIIFDKEKELFDIILFVFKNSISEIKVDALNLILLIDNENDWKYLENKKIKVFVQKEILPTFLIGETHNISLQRENSNDSSFNKENSSQEEKEEHDENEIDIIIEEKNSIEEKKENSHINKIKNEFIEKTKISEEEKKNKELKKRIKIKDLIYILFSSNPNLKEINEKYNKKKYNILVNLLFNKIFEYFQHADKLLNLVIKIVAGGDLLLISQFLSKMNGIIEEAESSKNKTQIYKQIINNNYFFQFILDTYLQLYIIINIKDKNKSFIPGFSINIFKNGITDENSTIPFEEKNIMEKINKALKDANKILKFLFDADITKFDYILSWGKYYAELKKENDIYQYAYDIINFFINEQLKSKEIFSFSDSNNSNNMNVTKIKKTLYFFNIFIEFFTYYNLKYKEDFFKNREEIINEQIKNDLKYFLVNNDLKSAEQNNENILYIKAAFSLLKPIFSGSEKKLLKNEDEVYTKYISGFVNRNIFNNELEILFHSYDELFINQNKDDICNQGMEVIVILYHFLTLFLIIGGEIREIKEYFRDLRLYLLLLITSPSTINLAETIKKKKWPNEEQNENVQKIIEIILFSSIFFLYNKIKEYRIQEKEYNIKIESEKDDESKKQVIENYQQKLEYICSSKKIYIENLGFILKILNKIYRGVKLDESQNKGFMNFFISKNKIAEKVKQTGAYRFINEIYNEFINSSTIKNNFLKKKKMSLEKNELTNSPKLKEKETEKHPEIKRKIYKSFTTKNLLNYVSDLSLNENNINTTPNKDEKEKEKKNSSKEVNKVNKSVNTSINEDNNNNSNNLSFTSNSSNSNIDISNILEENYLDDISKIVFCPKEDREINLSPEDYKIIENNINIFLDDEKILHYFEAHYEENMKKLYSFKSVISKRLSIIKTIIPIYDNRKNINNYPYDLCLMPYYYPISKYEEKLEVKVGTINLNLKEELNLTKKINDILDNSKENEYRKYKKKMFKFKRIWSYEDYFYDVKKYKLKYKLLNHYTNDFTKILLTPIIDVDYYLPKFSRFEGNIFRNEPNESSIIPITKITNICFVKKKEENMDKTNKEENEIKIVNPLYELNLELFSFLKFIETEKNKEENLLDNESKDFNSFTKYINKTHFENKAHCLQCEACLVKLSFHVRGLIYINNEEIGFYAYETKRNEKDEDYDKDRKSCFGSVFKQISEKYRNYFIKIPLKTIEFIFKRRYYFKKNVLEIFTYYKKSYFFRIDENKFNEFYDLVSNNKLARYDNLEDITIETSKNEEKVGLINKCNKLFEYNNYKNIFSSKKSTTIKNLYLKWTKWEISTFTLLNYMNLLSSRSYHDINQYPVFPWIVTNYSSNTLPLLNTENNQIRPFNKPMGMMDITEEAIERKNSYILSFDSKDDPDESSNRYGSHYSTLLYLTYYLVRVFPFSYLRIEIQGKNFDEPNRLFNSVESSFTCAITQKSDLRELIPEMFCFPEMFYNMNNLSLGEIYDEKAKINKLVNDIALPPWSANNGYLFISYHRELLESIEISEKIHEWFNIIFGSKQKGKAAKKIYNLFAECSYDIFDEEHKKADDANKLFQKNMVDFGVTPSQILKNDAEKRMLVKNLGKKPILYDYNIQRFKTVELFSNIDKEVSIVITESELFVEGNPCKIFSAWKKNDEHKSDKILYLYEDKVKINFFQKSKQINKISSEKSTPKKEDEEKEKEKGKDLNENVKEKETNSEMETEMNEIEMNKNISKFDKKLINPKYRIDMEHTPSIVYDKGNYLIMGGYWNGQIIINYLEDDEKKQKNKNTKYFNILFTNKHSPITLMKMDESETFLICANKIGNVFIFVNKQDKIEWSMYKIISDNEKEITSLDLNENLNIFITSDKEGYNNIYTFPQCKLFNSFKIKLNEVQLPINNNQNDTNNSSIASRSESNMNINISQNELYADIVIISNLPLPTLIFYIRLKKCLCVYSINFHLITTKYGFDLVQNGIRKYSDYFQKDYLFIFNKKENTIDIYDTINLNLILRSSKFEYNFIDFCFCKEMENALIMVRTSEEDKKEKNNKKNYKILMINTPGKGDNKD